MLDGRDPSVVGYEKGNFVGPTVISLNLQKRLHDTENEPDAALAVGDDGKLVLTSPLSVVNRAYVEELFGPVLFCVHVNTLDEAIAFINNSHYGNGCAIFTQR